MRFCKCGERILTAKHTCPKCVKVYKAIKKTKAMDRNEGLPEHMRVTPDKTCDEIREKANKVWNNIYKKSKTNIWS